MFPTFFAVRADISLKSLCTFLPAVPQKPNTSSARRTFLRIASIVPVASTAASLAFATMPSVLVLTVLSTIFCSMAGLASVGTKGSAINFLNSSSLTPLKSANALTPPISLSIGLEGLSVRNILLTANETPPGTAKIPASTNKSSIEGIIVSKSSSPVAARNIRPSCSSPISSRIPS